MQVDNTAQSQAQLIISEAIKLDEGELKFELGVSNGTIYHLFIKSGLVLTYDTETTSNNS